MAKASVVVGDGWSACAAVGFLVSQAAEVCWVSGSGARVLAPLPSLEAGIGAPAWKELAHRFGIEAGEAQTGSFLREFRNKAFREPLWTKAPTPETRRDVLNETLWAPEHRIAAAFETRFQLTLNEIEDVVRARLLAEDAPWAGRLRRIEGVPVTGFRAEEGEVRAVLLGSGEELECERVIYADRWAGLGGLGGLPKALPFTRRREAMGILQATFTHDVPMGAGVSEGFFGSLHKEAGEEIERHLWGHFSSDGRRSYWTLCIAPDECEDNHQIAKKLRRMKNSLDKMFTGESWLPQGKTDFMSTVAAEQVRFHEAMIFAEGEPLAEPATIVSLRGLSFVTDGYGPSWALRQVAVLFGIEPEQRPEPQAQGPDLEQSAGA